MPRFLSAEWAEAVSEALDGLGAPSAGAERSLTASSGSYRVAQLVHGVPEDLHPTGGVLATLLRVEEGAATLEVRAPEPDAPASDPLESANVTVFIAYDDAAALSRGDLDASTALADGKIRVRGDLSVLVASQDLLAAAGQRLEALRATTTY